MPSHPHPVPYMHAIFGGVAPPCCRLSANGMASPSSDGTISPYFVVVLACDGTVARSERVWSRDDEEALSRAACIADGRGVDVWDGLRFVEHVTST